MTTEVKELSDIANKLRIHVLKAVATTRTGHPSSCSSIAEIISVLFFKVMKFFLHTPKDPANDRLILSKGHAAPILYAAWAEAGHFPVDKLTNLRTLYSDLEGNPTPKLDFIDVATGSVGQGLPVAVGMAYVGKKIDTHATYRVFCIVGDGECSEGVVWSALNFASYYKLDNLCIIVDVNRLGETGQTALGANIEAYKNRFEAFDYNVCIVDGHNVEELIQCFDNVSKVKEKPSVMLAKTVKGKHFAPSEDSEGWHGKVLELDTDKCIKNLEAMITTKTFTVKPQSAPRRMPREVKYHVQLSAPPDYIDNRKYATNLACANGLVKIVQSHEKVYVFDTDVSDITFSRKVNNYDTSRFVQCFSSEEAAVGIAIGANCRERTIPFISTCGALLTKAFDAIRMGAISKTDINICASHCGITVGEDGPVAMALEDLAMFRAIPGCTIFYPSDAVSTERAVELAANTKGITYIRTSCYKVPVIYNNDKLFRTGEAHILRNHPADKLLVICGGVTLHEVLEAEMQLSNDGLHIRVMDIFTVKPIDREGILKNAEDIGGSILTVEDHYAEGGLGEAVLAAVADRNIVVHVIAVPKIPRSGTSKELLDYFGISASNIVMTIKEMFGANY